MYCVVHGIFLLFTVTTLVYYNHYLLTTNQAPWGKVDLTVPTLLRFTARLCKSNSARMFLVAYLSNRKKKNHFPFEVNKKTLDILASNAFLL